MIIVLLGSEQKKKKYDTIQTKEKCPDSPRKLKGKQRKTSCAQNGFHPIPRPNI